MLEQKNDQNEQKPKVELSSLYRGLVKVKKEHLIKPRVKKEQLIKPKVELSVGIPDSSTPGLKTAVAAKPRAERRLIRSTNPQVTTSTK